MPDLPTLGPGAPWHAGTAWIRPRDRGIRPSGKGWKRGPCCHCSPGAVVPPPPRLPPRPDPPGALTDPSMGGQLPIVSEKKSSRHLSSCSCNFIQNLSPPEAIAMAAEAGSRRGAAARRKAKEVAVGAAARVLFYPTLLYNVVRSKVQAEFRWWDEVDQFVLLGAVPFRRDVTRLQKLGVHGMITLNEPFETLVPSSMYKSRGIDHLVIPTRDYMFAPSLVDINQAIDFIHRNASCGKITYIHCKSGRGRSTTIVLCYLVKYKNMTPAAAFEHVRSKRARVLLTHSQWKVVQEFSKKNAELPALTSDSATAPPARDVVRVTVADLNGNDAPEFLTEDASLSCHKTTPSRPMIKMLSCLFPSRI